MGYSYIPNWAASRKAHDKYDFYIRRSFNGGANWGTETNLTDEDKAPEDLFYTFTADRGRTIFEEEWIVNPDSDGNHAGEIRKGWGRLAKSDAQEGEVQMRMTPDGSRLYSSWLEEGSGGNDIIFRRLTPKQFGANNLN